MTETDPQIEHIQITFEVFCKSVLKNKARSIHRKLNNIESREYPLSDFLTVPNLTDVKEDTYQLDDPITFEVKGQVIHVLDRELAQGIKSLVPKYRDVLLLSFFADCSDMEISRVLNIPVSTVRPRREAAIRRMRERIPNPVMK